VSVHQETLEIQTRGPGFVDITRKVEAVVVRSGLQTALCTVFVQHTSASLVIQENADPAVLRDLARWMADLAPESRDWEHDDEGPDDMPAHARSALTRSSWQAIYLWEHRARGHVRRVVVHVQGS
jgi:secondary thiamine-phosphate synthase enzyme